MSRQTSGNTVLRYGSTWDSLGPLVLDQTSSFVRVVSASYICSSSSSKGWKDKTGLLRDYVGMAPRREDGSHWLICLIVNRT